MDIHHLRVFVSVFKNRSFSRASEELHLSQPTVSDHIKGLEDELRCRLFDRTGRKVIPTEEARVLYARAAEIIEKLDGVRAAIGRLTEEISGELVIGASTIPGAYIIPPLASKFKRMHPAVSFQVVIEDSKKITDMVSAHELLMGVVGARMEHGQLEHVPFVEDELVLAASPGLIEKKAIQVKELLSVPVLLREEGSGTRKAMERHLAGKGVSTGALNVVAVLGSTDSIREAVKAGLGASVLSRIAIKDELKAGSLRAVKIKGLSIKRSFYIVTHKRRTLPKHYRAFLEYLSKRP